MTVKKLTYKQAGVDLGANTRWVNTLESSMRSTYGPRVLVPRHGGFAGLFRLDFDEQLFRRNYQKPVLVGCADGVGTKVLLATQLKQLSTIGIDLVAMNVNDLITCGAEPLFFLDYMGVHKLDPTELASVMEGIAAGCRESDCALLGGETAEMPALYRKGDFDLAGFCVGVVEFGKVIDATRVSRGDVMIGLPSSGVHSNGYTLVHKLVKRDRGCLRRFDPKLGETLGEALLRPTRLYVRSVLAVLRGYRVKRVVTGMAHITGGGLQENIARVLPKNCDVVMDRQSWNVPPVYRVLARLGIAKAEMFRVFNMGVGFVMFVRPKFATGVMRILSKAGEQPFVAGRVIRGKQRVQLR